MATPEDTIAEQQRLLQEQADRNEQLAQELAATQERAQQLSEQIRNSSEGSGGLSSLWRIGALIFLALFAGIVVWVKWPDTEEIVAQATADKAKALEQAQAETAQVKTELQADKAKALEQAQAEIAKVTAALAAEKAAKAAATETIVVSTNEIAKTAEGGGTPVAKTTEDLTLEMFKSLLWREGASREHGHILYPETPIVGDDFGERSTHFLAPLFLKYYRLEPVLKAKSGRKAWALVPIKNSLTPPKEILGMYKPK